MAKAKIAAPHIHHAYDVPPAVTITCEDESRTKQSFADDSDVNNIMRKYMATGQVSHLNNSEPNYGFAPSIDFKEAMDTVKTAQEGFYNLPAEIREKFGSDPVRFLEALESPDSDDLLRSLDLLPEEGARPQEARRDSEAASPPLAEGETPAEGGTEGP